MALKRWMRAGWSQPALFVALLAALAAGCYSSNYGRQVAATASLLSDLSDKLNDYCERDFRLDGGLVSSEEMGEFYYALKKARSYAAASAGSAKRPSYQNFLELVRAYDDFVRDTDKYRLRGVHDPEELKTIEHQHDLVRQRAALVLEAVRAESR